MDTETAEAARALLPDGAVYADWAASALPLPYPDAPVFIPPAHNRNAACINAARSALSKFLHDENERYDVVFTSGATAALRILADRLPWSPNASLFVHAHVHNAVLGIRNQAVAAGAAFRSLQSDELETHLGDVNREEADAELLGEDEKVSCGASSDLHFALLAYPGECNLTGTVYPFRWARQAKRSGVFQYCAEEVITLVDTAKLAASGPLDLSEHDNYVDAFVFSLYKLSASYTGLGALLVRKGSKLDQLLRSTAAEAYFAGGRSVEAVSPFSTDLFAPAQSLAEQLEVGTPNLQAIYHLPSQLSYFSPSRRIMASVKRNASDVAASFRHLLQEAFGGEHVKIHKDRYLKEPEMTSTVVAFTLYRRRDGSDSLAPIGHGEIATILKVNHIFARAGCMCNAGACASVLQLSDPDIEANYRLGHRCDDGMDLLRGHPTGVTRVSFGWASRSEDAMRIVRVLRSHVSVSIARQLSGNHDVVQGPRFRVDGLFTYPVKSCGGYASESLFSDGQGSAIGDRVFGVENLRSGELLTLKSNPSLACITARYSRCNSTLILEWNGESLEKGTSSVVVIQLPEGLKRDIFDGLSSMKHSLGSESSRPSACAPRAPQAPVRHAINDCRVNKWLTLVTGTTSHLVVLNERERYRDSAGSMLVVSKDELRCLAKESKIKGLAVLCAAIRPNVVLEAVDSVQASFKGGKLESSIYDCGRFYCADASLMQRRHCNRCVVVNNVTQALTGVSHGEPLRSIARINQQNERRSFVFGLICHFTGKMLTLDRVLETELQTKM